MEYSAGQSARLLKIPGGKPQPSSRPQVRAALYTVSALWLPCAALSLFSGTDALQWFVSDYAAQSRILLVVPLMILGTPPLGRRLLSIAQHFVTAKIVEERGGRSVEPERAALEQEREPPRLRLIFVAVGLAFALLAIRPVQSAAVLLPWCYRESGSLSPAGWFYLLIVLPYVAVLFLQWIWKQWLWTKFLRKVSGLKLRLIASHPDHVGGLGFLEWVEWEYAPACLAIGTLFAGGVGNRIAYSDLPLAAYKYAVVAPIVLVLVFCVGPLCIFQRPLLKAKRGGVFSYGRASGSVGRLFEDKWLPENAHLNYSALGAHDIAGAKHFASIVEDVYKMRLIPVTSLTVIRLIIWTLLPMGPVIVAAVGFDVLFRQALKMLL